VARFSPRDELVVPSQFGRARRPEWVPLDVDADLLSRARRALAFLQHELAVAVGDEIRERGVSQAELAGEIGVPAGTFGKKLRGHDPLHSEDMFVWVLHLGRVDLWPVPANLDDLLP
jgi:hypothetical protein